MRFERTTRTRLKLETNHARATTPFARDVAPGEVEAFSMIVDQKEASCPGGHDWRGRISASVNEPPEARRAAHIPRRDPGDQQDSFETAAAPLLQIICPRRIVLPSLIERADATRTARAPILQAPLPRSACYSDRSRRAGLRGTAQTLSACGRSGLPLDRGPRSRGQRPRGVRPHLAQTQLHYRRRGSAGVAPHARPPSRTRRGDPPQAGPACASHRATCRGGHRRQRQSRVGPRFIAVVATVLD